ncbi:winged helix-turn-helix transcriptional regulator [Paraglaciecola sp.]|uniref:winged helix-turn-helix transcriptional regulator n=1 Tax=Paraglaciecola sp. TaxID=1920173 RepID=UPI003EF3C488
MRYGQFCPIAKASEVLCERWTMLILRELLIGSTRYNELQKAMSKISPTLLSKRLNELEQANLLIKKKIPGGRSHEYFLTQAGKDLGPIVMQLGEWGMQWARKQMDLDDQDIELLMWDIRRNIKSDKIPGRHAVLKFHFTDLDEHANWWIVVKDKDCDLCTDDPCLDVDLYFTTDVATLINVWMGDCQLHQSISKGNLKILGDKGMKNTIKDWFGLSLMSPHGKAFSSPT